MKDTPPRRLASLDALRGFDMFFIMGGGMLLYTLGACYPDTFFATLQRQVVHSAWNGFTFEDLIFPLFLFLAGMSFAFSAARALQTGRGRMALQRKVLRRGLTLVALGVLYNGALTLPEEGIRYASVLGRIGVAWMLAATLVLWCRRAYLYIIGVAILLGYAALLAWCVAPDAPIGAGGYTMEGSIVGYVDRLLLPGRLLLGVHDPEGILSTLPAVVTALLGYMAGERVRRANVNITGGRTALELAVAGAVLLAAGWGLDGVCPVNKNLWTSTFVCVAAGWSLLLFAAFYYVIDVRQWHRWAFPFVVIGMNSVTIYLAQAFINVEYTTSQLFGGVVRLIPSLLGSVLYWAGYTLVCWLLLYFLWRKRIFLKV